MATVITGSKLLKEAAGESIANRPYANQHSWMFVVKLSPREEQVLKLYLSIGRLKPVAEILGVSVDTARIQKSSVMRKLGATNTVELMRAAVQRGLIELKS